MTLLVPLRVAGCLLLGLAASHVFLPSRLNWKEDLGRLTLVNRQIFYVHVFFITLTLMMMGALSLLFPHLLITASPLARVVLGGLALFWVTRLVFQWFVYDRNLWRGDRVRTRVHWLLTALWVYLSAVYAAAFWGQVFP